MTVRELLTVVVLTTHDVVLDVIVGVVVILKVMVGVTCNFQSASCNLNASQHETYCRRRLHANIQ